MDGLSTLIKKSFSDEIDAWVESGNEIKIIGSGRETKIDSGFNNRNKKKEQNITMPIQKTSKNREIKHRATKEDEKAKWSDVLIIKNWVEGKVGRVNDLAKEVGIDPAYLSQIKNSKRSCSKERMIELLNAKNKIEIAESLKDTI